MPTRGEAKTGARILVVDDDVSAAELLQCLLTNDGYEVSTACDGEDALSQATRVLPDVVLTDLDMPKMNGVELCKQLHALDRGLPVLVMTAHYDTESVTASLDAGADDYLFKPLQYEAVLWRVQRTLARRAASLELATLQRTLNERLVLSSVREQELAEAEVLQRAQVEALLENLTEGVVIADRSERIVMINSAARHILGVEAKVFGTVDQLQGFPAHDLRAVALPPDERPLTRALRGEPFSDYEVRIARPNGDWRSIVSTGTCVRDERGDVALAIVVFRDVTALRSLEREREEVAGLISHDLRNPLNSIVMSFAMLKTSAVEAGRTADVSLVERGERNVKRMTAMLDELTEATVIEAHGGSVERLPCDLRTLVDSVVDQLDDASARRITVASDDTSAYVVLANASRLERAIANLLTNALKYSGDGAPVSVRLSRNGSSVELAVIDQGIGIARESLALLFGRYYRANAAKARAKGLGLGLYISRLIVEAHGGRIDVRSELGAGSTFRVILPAAAS